MSSKDPEHQLRQEAQDWLMRLTSGGATVEDAAGAKLWCDKSSANARAFAEAALLWDALEPAARRMASQNVHYRRINLDRRALLAGALAASGATAGYLVLRPPFEFWPSLPDLMADYRTGTGERRRVMIASGASIEMNTRTSLNIPSRSKNDQKIELISGEVAVTTGKVSSLVVSAANGRVFATQARFDIFCDGALASVTCLQGTVAVEYQARRALLRQGQQVIYNGEGLGAVAAVDPEDVTAWRQGRLVFHGVALARVIAQINRYRSGRIILLNSALAERLVDVTLRVDQTDQIIHLVRAAYGASVTTLPGGMVVLS